MARQGKRRTDFGTVALHWLLVAVLVFEVLTGLRITSNAPGYGWLQLLDPLLPAATVWSSHILAGLVLFGTTLAYIAYISQAGLARRIWPDKARLLGLFGRKRARLSAISVILYWIFFAQIALLIGTGLLMYLGRGGQLVQLHRLATWGVLAFPFLHVAIHYAVGGMNQLLRICRPAHLIPPPPPFDPFEILALAPPQTKSAQRSNAVPRKRPPPHPRPANVAEEWRRGDNMLQSNPLVVAIAAGFTGVLFMMSFDRFYRDELRISRIAPADAPVLDGDVADPAWASAAPIFVDTQQGLNFDGKGATTVEIRAVHDGKTAYFSFSWQDSTRSLKYLPLLKKKDGWYVVQDGFDREDENSYNDDSFAVALTTTDRPSIRYPGGNTFHIGPKPLPDKPASFAGRGLHYTKNEQINDVWHWKASRGGMLGWCDDGYIGLPAEPTQAQKDGEARYYAGLAMDPGDGMSQLNFKQQQPGGYVKPIQPKRLPSDPRATWKAMGQITPYPSKSESDGAVWWLTESQSVPYSPQADAQFPVGALIPGVLITAQPSGDRANVRCAARWAAGRWTLEASRLLDTRSENDVVIGNQTAFRIAAFDHSQIGHTRQIRAIRMELE